MEMPTGDTSIPIGLLRDTADALLKLPGAKVCDPVTQRPIVGLSTEYCSTIYVAGNRDALSWRMTEPIKGTHDSCSPFFVVRDDDHPAAQVWVVGYIHNHPCAAAPSSRDLGAWPTDGFNPYVTMAEVRLVPGNPAPGVYKNGAIEMASALVAERRLPAATIRELERRGHLVAVDADWCEGRLTAAARDGRRRRAAANPRGMQGYAAGR